jgi:hypothetical protein
MMFLTLISDGGLNQNRRRIAACGAGQKNTAGLAPAVGAQKIGTAKRTALINSSRRRAKIDLGCDDVDYHWVVPPFFQNFSNGADFMPPARLCQGDFARVRQRLNCRAIQDISHAK